MNKSNIPLWIAGVLLLGMGWIVFDMSRSGAASSKGGSSLSAVRNAKVPVLLEFYADWCPPCKEIAPMVEELTRELKGKAVIVRINVDENYAVMNEHGVGPLPTFIAFKNGKETSREEGPVSKEKMREMMGL
ncbi:MAG TPA: thioredoxin family protein [Prosthecobacter sp.]